MAKKAILVEVVETRRKQIIIVGDPADGFDQSAAEEAADSLWKNDELDMGDGDVSYDCEIEYLGEASEEDMSTIQQYDAVTGECCDDDEDYEDEDDEQ